MSFIQKICTVILTDTEKQLASFKELSENRLKEIEQLKMELENTHHTDDDSIPHSLYYICYINPEDSLPVSSYEQIEEGIISLININYYLYRFPEDY